MVLLALVAIAFLGLATVTARSSNHDRSQEEAKANARLALMMAMGQLQRDMGPDQRVSAPASILSKNEFYIKNPHWTGVWKTSQENGKPVVVRDDSTGGLVDKRDPDIDPIESRINYLVSGNERGLGVQKGLNFEARDSIQGESVLLVGNGTVGGDKRSFVSVPKVGVFDQRKRVGAYGYWVGDLGIKANLKSLNPYRDSQGVEVNLPLLGGMNASGAYKKILNNNISMRPKQRVQAFFYKAQGKNPKAPIKFFIKPESYQSPAG